MEQWTVAKWCREVGGDRHEFQRRVAASDVKPTGEADGRSKGAKLYRLRDLVNVALGGDYEAERLRKTKEEADKLALANAKERGEVVEIGAVIQFGEKVFASVRQKILNMPLTDEEKDKCLAELLALKDKDWSA
jgi:phage terminase Nu1 subunit (DNA packaging protein)